MSFLLLIWKQQYHHPTIHAFCFHVTWQHPQVHWWLDWHEHFFLVLQLDQWPYVSHQNQRKWTHRDQDFQHIEIQLLFICKLYLIKLDISYRSNLLQQHSHDSKLSHLSNVFKITQHECFGWVLLRILLMHGHVSLSRCDLI